MRGLSPHTESVSAERTPHPALRATFSHKGRREESLVVARQLLSIRMVRRRFSAVSNHEATLVPNG